MRVEPRHRDGGEQGSGHSLRAGRRALFRRTRPPAQRLQRDGVFGASHRLGDDRTHAGHFLGNALRRRTPRVSRRTAFRVRRRSARADAQGYRAGSRDRCANAAESRRTAIDTGSSRIMDVRAPSHIETEDPEIFAAIAGEERRQIRNLELIASENYASAAVREAMGCVMTNKYAEGYPGKRYYGGCEFVDVAERLAIDRLKTLFGAEHANVQPHSGAPANMA